MMISENQLQDKWFRVCKSEVLKDKPLSKKINGIPIVLFRGENNKVGVLLDRCPHRNIPMSKGYIENQNLVCRFHGWHFDTEGTCVKVSQLKNLEDNIERNAFSFDSFEEEGFVYVKCNHTKKDFPHIDEHPSEIKTPIPKINSKAFYIFYLKLFIFFAIIATIIYLWFALMPYFLTKIIGT